MSRFLDAIARGPLVVDGAMGTQLYERGVLYSACFEELNVSRAWEVVMRAVVQGFYSHPWAWNEMGFGGPAYPRGYAALGAGHKEHWEGDEAFEIDPVKDVEERGLE